MFGRAVKGSLIVCATPSEGQRMVVLKTVTCLFVLCWAHRAVTIECSASLQHKTALWLSATTHRLPRRVTSLLLGDNVPSSSCRPCSTPVPPLPATNCCPYSLNHVDHANLCFFFFVSAFMPAASPWLWPASELTYEYSEDRGGTFVNNFVQTPNQCQRFPSSRDITRILLSYGRTSAHKRGRL